MPRKPNQARPASIPEPAEPVLDEWSLAVVLGIRPAEARELLEGELRHLSRVVTAGRRVTTRDVVLRWIEGKEEQDAGTDS